MARISMCDRCEAVGNGDAVAVLTHRPALNSPDTRSAEICPDCYGEFLAFMGSADKDAKRPAFRNPYEDPETQTAITAGTADLLRAAADLAEKVTASDG